MNIIVVSTEQVADSVAVKLADAALNVKLLKTTDIYNQVTNQYDFDKLMSIDSCVIGLVVTEDLHDLNFVKGTDMIVYVRDDTNERTTELDKLVASTGATILAYDMIKPENEIVARVVDQIGEDVFGADDDTAFAE